MSMKKVLSVPENGRNIEGLVEMLRKTSPGGMAELADRGGRLGGKPMANDDEEEHDPNGSRITMHKKI